MHLDERESLKTPLVSVSEAATQPSPHPLPSQSFPGRRRRRRRHGFGAARHDPHPQRHHPQARPPPLSGQEYTQIRGVRDDIQFINDELGSMQAFASNLSSSGADGADHDDQTKVKLQRRRLLGHHPKVPLRPLDVLAPPPDCQGDRSPQAPGRADWAAPHQVRRPQPGALQEKQRPGWRHRVPDRGAPAQLVRIQQPVGVRDMEMAKLDGWILPDNNSNLAVLTIFGFGGMGKTTTAMALYRRFGDQFQRRAIVTVSQNTRPEAVLMDILSQFNIPQDSNVPAEQQGGQTTSAVVKSIVSRLCLRDYGPVKEHTWDEVHNGIKTQLQKHLQSNRYHHDRYLVLCCFSLQLLPNMCF